MKSIELLIINYKSEDIIMQCINSINESELDVTIHILNNDPEVVLSLGIESERKINLYNSKKNLGFAAGVNFLVSKILKSEYFLILNPDAVLEPNSISILLNEITSNNQIAVISPFIKSSSGQFWFNLGYIDFGNSKIINVNSTEKLNFAKAPTDLFNGCCALFRTKAFIEAGGFKNELFMYFDEAFLSMKLREMGYLIYISGAVIIHHNVSYSTRDMSSFKVFYITRNGLAFFWKYTQKSKVRVVFNYLFRGLYYLKHLSISGFFCYYKAVFCSIKLTRTMK